MKFKKSLVVLIAVILAFSTLWGCSSSNQNAGSNTSGETSSGNTSNNASNNTQTEAPKEDTTPITIQYWHSHGDTQIEGLNYMIEEFQKKYPHITIEPVFQGSYGDLEKKLLASLAANDVPAVTVLESASLANFADSGVLADLTPYIEKNSVDLNDFSKGMLRAYNYEGTQYGLPLVVSASVFVYNKKMLEEAGVEPPQTWEELEEFGKKMTIKNGNEVERYAFAIPGWSSWYYDPWIVNGGGVILTEDGKSGLDQENTKKFLKKFQEWKDNGWMMLPYGKGASGNMRQAFFDGKVAMIEHTSSLIDWYLQNSEFEIGVSFLPGDEKRMTMIGGAGIVIMEAAPEKEKEAAAKFVEFMTSVEHNIKWASSTGYLPTRKSAVETEEGQQWLANAPQYQAVLDWFDNVEPRVQHVAYGEFRKFYEEAVGKIALEGGDVDQLMNEAAEKMNQVLADY